jgi:hypothetical protein
MGNYVSSEAVHVAVIGLTDTGKSHFLSLLSEGVLNIETTHPTFGSYETVFSYRRRRIVLTEMGSHVYQSWKNQFMAQNFSCIMWFIDEHDTLEDIYKARNRLVEATRETMKRIPLCVVHNIGRPHAHRRYTTLKNGKLEWREDDDDNGMRIVAVPWVHLSDALNVSYLEMLHKTVYLTQLSYRDRVSPVFLLDWILNAATLD